MPNTSIADEVNKASAFFTKMQRTLVMRASSSRLSRTLPEAIPDLADQVNAAEAACRDQNTNE